MSEKPETEEFDDEEDDAVVDSDDLNLDNLIEDIDERKAAAPKSGEPAWRRLERYREERQTAELLSDINDFDIGDIDDIEDSLAADMGEDAQDVVGDEMTENLNGSIHKNS